MAIQLAVQRNEGLIINFTHVYKFNIGFDGGIDFIYRLDCTSSRQLTHKKEKENHVRIELNFLRTG